MDHNDSNRKAELRAIWRQDLQAKLEHINRLERQLAYDDDGEISPVRLVNHYRQLGDGYRSLLKASALEIANDVYQRALEIIHSEEYSGEMREKDRERLDETLKSAIKQESKARTAIILQAERSKDMRVGPHGSERIYNGVWAQRKTFVLSLVWFFGVVSFGILSFYARIPISVGLHIPPYNCVAGSITVNGSTDLLPFMSIAKSQYEKLCSGSNISINPGRLPDGKSLLDGSANGLSEVQQNTINIATSDVFADPTMSNLQEHPLAVVVYALVMHNDITSTTIPNLTSDQIAIIYSGGAQKWSDLNPAWSSAYITLVSRPASSEVRGTFEKYVLDSSETVSGPSRLVSDDMDTVAKLICDTRGSIGYVSLYYYYYYATHYNHCMRLVTIDQKDPQSVAEIKNNTYQFWSLGHLYTNGSAQGLSGAFIDFLYSDTMKTYLNQYDMYGFLNPSDISPSLLSSH